MSSSLRLFASAPRGIEPLLADELRALGGGNVKETRAGVTFDGDLALAYRVCLWSRVAQSGATAARAVSGADTGGAV